MCWMLAVLASPASPAHAGQCTSAADCQGLGKPACVTTTDGNWSQCIDCNSTAFKDACPYWSASLREPAEKVCGLKCDIPKPQCRADTDCPTNASKCVIQADKHWAQCVSCDERDFQEACVHWERHEFLPAAEEACKRNCTGAAPNASETFCCCTCSAGGCSAEYSPTDEHVPTTAGECIRGGKISPIPYHGANCGEPTYCCYWCSAGGCSAEYSVQDEHVPADVGKCVKGGYIADLDAPHGQICKMPNASAPQQLYLASAAFASAMVESR